MNGFAPADGGQAPVPVIEPKTQTNIATMPRRQSRQPQSRSTPHTNRLLGKRRRQHGAGDRRSAQDVITTAPVGTAPDGVRIDSDDRMRMCPT